MMFYNGGVMPGQEANGQASWQVARRHGPGPCPGQNVHLIRWHTGRSQSTSPVPTSASTCHPSGTCDQAASHSTAVFGACTAHTKNRQPQAGMSTVAGERAC